MIAIMKNTTSAVDEASPGISPSALSEVERRLEATLTDAAVAWVIEAGHRAYCKDSSTRTRGAPTKDDRAPTIEHAKHGSCYVTTALHKIYATETDNETSRGFGRAAVSTRRDTSWSNRIATFHPGC